MLVIDDFNDLLALESFFRRVGFDVLSLGKDSLVADAMLGFVPDFVMMTAKGRVVDGSKLAIRLKNLPSPPVVAAIYPAGQPPVLTQDAEAAIDALVEIPFHPKMLLGLLADRTGIDKRALIEKFERLRAAKLQGLEDPDLFRDEDSQRSELQVVRGGEDFASDLIRSMAGTEISGTQEALSSLVDDLKGQSKPVRVSSQVGGVSSSKSPASVSRSTHKSTQGASSAGDQPPPISARLERYEKFLGENQDDVSRVISRADAIAAREKLKAASKGEKEELDRIDAEKRAFVRSLFDREDLDDTKRPDGANLPKSSSRPLGKK